MPTATSLIFWQNVDPDCNKRLHSIINRRANALDMARLSEQEAEGDNKAAGMGRSAGGLKINTGNR